MIAVNNKLALIVFLLLSITDLRAEKFVLDKLLHLPPGTLWRSFLFGCIIPTGILFIVSFALVRAKKCIIFSGRRDQINCFLTFILPILLGGAIGLILYLLESPKKILIVTTTTISGLLFLYGLFHLIRNAFISNRHRWLIPFVIVVKLYFGLYVGIAFIFSIMSWSQNARKYKGTEKLLLWTIRILSLLIGGVFILMSNALTSEPDDAEESNLSAGGFDGNLSIGRGAPKSLRM